MPTLENEYVRLTVSETGMLTELIDKACGHNYAGGGPLWRLYVEDGDRMDLEFSGADARPEIVVDDATLRLRYASVARGDRSLAVTVVVEARLEGDETRWSIALENHESDILLRECQFPLISGLRLAEEQSLLWSRFGGEIVRDLPGRLRNHFTNYMACDHRFLHMDVAYPGFAATNCYVFTSPAASLYCACCDASCEHTLHLFRLYGERLECGFVRYPSLRGGAACRIGEFVLSPHRGDWHVAARKYRAWADGWFQPPRPPAWIRAMKGWQRIIMKHQYGEVHYRYDQLAQIQADGLDSGIDTLHIFGWWTGGMDNSNPDYVADSALGGEALLAESVAAFQQRGSVILYANGCLIDLATDYYKSVGHRISIKDKFGAECRDVYRFRGDGTFTGHFGNRDFAVACPSSVEWLEKMKEVIDTATRLGCRGVFFDQLGFTAFPCFDASHGHETPFMRVTRQRAEMTRLLRDYVREQDPEMGIGTEWISDVCAQHCDFIHSISGFCQAQNDWEATGEKPIHALFIDWFRYCFPEVILTDREIRDDTDVERRVNHALLKGLRSDVEIYRCRRTIAETPHYAAYLAQANELRARYQEFLLEGRYVDTEGFRCDNSEIDVRAFRAGDRLALVATQSHRPSESAILDVPGFRFAGAGGLGDWSSVEAAGSVKLDLARQGVAVLVFEKIA